MLRRLRGLFSVSLPWSFPWALAALGLVAFVRVSGKGYQQRRLEELMVHADWPSWAGGVWGYFAARGALIGVMNGLLFAVVIAIAVRRGTKVEAISTWKFALLGALATGATASVLMYMPPVMSVSAAVLGAVSGAAYLALAKRRVPTRPTLSRDVSGVQEASVLQPPTAQPAIVRSPAVSVEA